MAPLLSLLALAVGVLIGMAGVGGVLLPPGLVAFGGMSANEATATSTWAFIFTGIVGTAVYACRGVVPWRMLGWLAVGVVPAAFIGALVNATLPGSAVLLVLAALTLFVGTYQLLPHARRIAVRKLRASALIRVGALVGFGSALTGTGGPVMLVPILLALGVAPLKAVAVSQAVQLPVVLSGSMGYLHAGLTDLRLGTLLGAIAAFGAILGAFVATGIQADGFRKVVAWVCIVAGAFLLARGLD